MIQHRPEMRQKKAATRGRSTKDGRTSEGLRAMAGSRAIVSPMKRIPATPPLRVPMKLAASPWLCVMDGFATKEECAAVLDLYGDEAWIEAHADHYGWDHAGFAAEVPADADALLAALAWRMENAMGAATEGCRTLRLRYYGEGEGHRLHGDAYEFEGLRLARTALLYLMDTEAGGETRFPYSLPVPLAIAPRRGRLVVWSSTLPDASEDPASRHDAAPVLSGAKASLLAFTYLSPMRHADLPTDPPVC